MKSITILTIVFIALLLMNIILFSTSFKDIVHDIKFIEFRGGQIDKQFWKDNQGETFEFYFCEEPPCNFPTPERKLIMSIPEYKR